MKHKTAEIHTLRFGDAPWLAACTPTIERWAARYATSVYVWGLLPKLATPKLVVKKALSNFLKGDSSQFIYLDADVYVNPDAPPFPAVEGIGLTTDAFHQVHNDHFREWVAEHYQGTVPEDWQYCNAGIWTVDRESARALLAAMNATQFHEFFQEQHWFNWCVIQSGITVRHLSSAWNRAGQDPQPSWIFHLWGDTKMEDLARLREMGVLDRLPEIPVSTPAGATPLIHAVSGPETGKTVVLEFIQDGGLGNQMFEWAAGYSIAKTLGLPFTWVWKPSGLRDFGLQPFGIGHNPARKLNLVMQRAGQGSRRLRELAVRRIAESAHKEPAISCPFQDEQCFIDHADDIAKRFDMGVVDLPIPEGTVPVGVQVRRGDYLKHSRLNVTTPEYFTNGMRWMRERIPNSHFIVVSDDPQWCRQFFGYREDVLVMPPQEPIDGIRTLASCKGHIISNSTFGWWGAWLGERKFGGPVVVPELWHHGGKSYGQWEPVPERWNRVGIGPFRRTVEIEVQDPIVAAMPDCERAIVYPYHADQERWHELRYSLRSIDRFFEDRDCPIFILGTRKPGWLIEGGRVRYIGAFTYREALSRGVAMAEQVLWMNDDIVMLRETGWADCRRTLYLKDVGPEFLERAETQANPWREGVVRILRALAGEGIRQQRVYSTHTPYVYRREQAMEILRKYGVWEKFPMELAYFHHYAVDPVQITGERVTGLPFGDARFLNYADRSLSDALKREIAALLPDCPAWELPLNWGI